ncbi:hypothetical protein B9Z55_020737 [Caenorhabditis nigoni]|uniref:Cytochrome b561 domain-containing protein n=1 Tax=Caenorhabditis nigoni TaxID=1611254 RepID=A0A2G5TNX9_9PELO|nr:hypothetical protein B9Z55_020737 [Caenorhabditis nigoni]
MGDTKLHALIALVVLALWRTRSQCSHLDGYVFMIFGSVPVALELFRITSKVLRHGYGSHTRKWFHFIALAAFLIVLLTVAAVTLIGVYLDVNSNRYGSYSLGYSAWISIGASVVCLGVIGLAFALSRKDGCC